MAAEIRELGSLTGIHIKAHDLKAGAPQAMHKRLTEQADADDPDLKTFSHCRGTSRYQASSWCRAGDSLREQFADRC